MSHKAEGIRFRESLKGYHKEDVNSYIEQQDRLFAEAEGDYRRRLEAADRRIAELTAQNQELSARLTACQNDTALKDKLAEAENQIAECSRQLEQKNAELEAAGKRMETLEKKLEESDSCAKSVDGEREKAQLYDKMSHQLGDMFFTAGESADKIVTAARENAAKITEEAETMRRETADALRRLREEASSGFKEMAEEERRTVENYHAVVMKNLSELLYNLRSGSAEVQNEGGEKVRRLYERLLGEIDRICPVPSAQSEGSEPSDKPDSSGKSEP